MLLGYNVIMVGGIVLGSGCCLGLCPMIAIDVINVYHLLRYVRAGKGKIVMFVAVQWYIINDKKCLDRLTQGK